MTDQPTPGVLVPIPLPATRVFRNQAMDDVLSLLYRNPHEEFGVRELRDVTGHGAQTVDTALDLFTQLDLVETRRRGNQKLVRINQARIRKPDDPILEIPQEPFRAPVIAFLDELQAAQENVVGVLVFGSVARGEADRASDIDLFVVVADELMAARRTIHEIRQDLSNRTFDGSRYEFEVMVESVESANQYGEKLRTVLSEGIILQESAELEAVQEAVFHGE
ncbi:MAG: nucleotidyltransferase domain-containing protein [Halodesulfurarchaeum sp.]|nr:nucleotidyltransferase domain-containing protein [Halodesulfurarchaeum sp.]